MRGKDANGDAERADLAFNRVLAAEASTRARVDVCRSEAEGLIKMAEERARRVLERAETRILKTHRLADASVERALRSLHASEPAGADGEPGAVALARLDQAIERLADDILGFDERVGDAGIDRVIDGTEA